MKTLRRLLYRPNVGAVSELRNLGVIEIGYPWIDRISVSISWLLLFFVALVAVLPLPDKKDWNVDAINIVAVSYLFYLVALEVLSRRLFRFYDVPAARIFRTSVNLSLVSVLVYFSQGADSYFWCLYSLPIFQANIYLRRWGVVALIGLTLVLYWTTAVLASNSGAINYAFLLSNSLMLVLLAVVIYWLFGAARESRKQEYETMVSLRRAALDIAEQVHWQEVLDTVIERAVEILRARGGGIYTYDRTTERLTVAADVGGKQSIRGHQLKRGEGMAGRVVEGGQPMIVDDYSTWPHRCPDLEPDLFRAVVEVPLVQADEILGVLYVTDDAKGRTFTNHDADVLCLLAHHAAITINNVGQYEASERNVRQLQLIERISAEMAHARSVDDLLERTLTEALKAVGARDGSIMIFDPTTLELEIKAWIVNDKFQDCNIHKRFGVGEGIAGHVADTLQAYNCKDTSNDEHFRQSVTKRHLRSILSVPIVANHNLVCIINSDSTTPNFFDDDAEQLFSKLGAHMATALEAIRLREIGFMLSSLTPEELPEKIVESAYKLLGADVATLFLKEGDGVVRAAVYPPAEAKNVDPPRKDGLTNQILANGVYRIIEDAQADERVKDELKQRGIRSLIGVPLNVLLNGGPHQTLGVLFASTRKVRKFGHGERHVIESLASQAAVSINQAGLHKKMIEELDFQQSLLASAFDAIIAIDEEGRVTEFNPTAERILRYSKEEVIGQKVGFLYSDFASAQNVMNQLNTEHNKGRLVNYYTYVQTKDGEQIPIRLSASLLKNGSVGFFQDQREIENRRQQMQQLHGLFAGDDEITGLDDLKSNLTRITNTVGEALDADVTYFFYYSQERREFEPPAITLGSRREYSPNLEPRLLTYLTDLINSSEVYVFDNAELDGPSLGTFFVELEGIVSLVAARVPTRNKIFGVMVCAYRHSESFDDEKRLAMRNLMADAATEIEQAQERLQVTNLLTRLYKAVLTLKTETSFEVKLLSQLDQAVKSTKAEYGALALVNADQRVFLQIGVPDELAKQLRLPKHTGLLGRFLKEEKTLNLPDVEASDLHTDFGDHRHPKITSFLGRSILSQGRPVGSIYLGNKRGTEKFSETDAELLGLFAVLASLLIESHDAQQVAHTKQAIKLSAALLSQLRPAAREKGARLASELAKLHDLIPSSDRESLIRITNTIRELDSDIAYLQAGLEKGPSELFSLARILNGIERQKVVPEQMLELHVHDDSWVRGYPLLMTLACRILIANAARAVSSVRGTAETKLSRTIHFSAQHAGSNVRGIITDKGVGIPEAMQPYLFKEPVTNTKHELCYGSFIVGVIIRLHEGTIKVKETGPRGTTIEFFLPAEIG